MVTGARRAAACRATGIAMLDGYVAAIVAGPVSINPLDWICPLLAVDADAWAPAARLEQHQPSAYSSPFC
jgi:hypothetical protein